MLSVLSDVVIYCLQSYDWPSIVSVGWHAAKPMKNGVVAFSHSGSMLFDQHIKVHANTRKFVRLYVSSTSVHFSNCV